MSLRPEKTDSFSYRDLARHFLPIVRPYSLRFGAGISLIVLSTGIDLLTPILLGRAVDTVAMPSPDRALLYRICWLFLGLVAAKYVFDIFKAYLIQSAGEKVKHDLRTLLFTRIAHLPVTYFDRNPIGRPLTRVVNDVRTHTRERRYFGRQLPLFHMGHWRKGGGIGTRRQDAQRQQRC